jgi:hypothetical protein
MHPIQKEHKKPSWGCWNESEPRSLLRVRGKGKLCYPIEGQRKGLYYLACFTMDGGSMIELNRLSKLNEVVMRQLVLRHPKVIFDAMVDALTQHDGAIHSPEQKADRDARDRPAVEDGVEEVR